MQHPNNELLNQIQNTLSQQGHDYRKWIDELGQVAAFEARQSGKAFSLREHVRALLLAKLSNNRPWGPIATNLDRISAIFLSFDPAALKATDPEFLVRQIKDIRCGNRSLAKQMAGLKRNIETFERIGDIDRFVTSEKPEHIAKQFASGRHKLIQIGFPLAMEYLRNVGIDSVKPDVHICRMIGPDRLGLSQNVPSAEQAHAVLSTWARKTNQSAMYVDNLLWLFAAKDYAAICTANPQCNVCLVSNCNRQTFCG